MFDTPVLLMIYKRPDKTAKVFEVIRQIKPKKLFVAADGPKKGSNDGDLCLQVRSIATKVDWPCEVRTLFRDNNIGAGRAVSGAITWLFEHVDRGIILEDDCLPDESFFRFCDVLLNKYAVTREIMSISGTNLLPNGWKQEKQSYLFAHGGVWGWATWKRAWDLFDYDMPAWASDENKDKIRKAMNHNSWFDYYFGMFEGAYQKELDAWDLQWFYCILNNGGLAINPTLNLVRNIGFGPDATNTSEVDGPYSNMELRQMEFPLKHPPELKPDKKYLRVIYRFVVGYKKTFKERAEFWMRLYFNKITRNSPAEVRSDD
jgi:hypothetical protein